MRALGVGAVASGVAVATGARPASAAPGEPLPIDLDSPLADLTIGMTGTAISLLDANPILGVGALAYASDTNQLFIGDGETPLVDLDPIESASGVELGSATDGEARSFSNVTTDYPNLTLGPITVPAGKAAYIHLFLPNGYNTSSGTFASFTLVHGAGSSSPENTAIDDGVCLLVGAGGVFTTVDKSTVARIGPGTSTVKVRVFDSKDSGATEVNFLGLAKARLWAVLA